MLKGHLQIELKDEKTKKVQVYEQDNMVTNAVASLLGIASNVSPYNNMMQNLIPIAKRALGGLFLFDGNLEEDPDNIHFPMDVHLVGCAGRVSNTVSKIIGSFNSAETHRTDTGYVSVWDFSTSQANGTIASLALTDYKCGEDPFYNTFATNSSINTDRSYTPLCIDSEKGIAYFYSGGKVYTKQLFSHIIRVASPYFGEEEELCDLNLTDPTHRNWSISNGYDGYLYAIYCPSHSKKETATIRVKKYKISDFSFKEESDQTFAVNNISPSGSSSPSYYLNENCVVSRGYLYIVQYNGECIYKINLSNTVDVKELKFGNCYVSSIFPRYNGGVLGWLRWTGTTGSGSKTTYYSPAIIYPDGKYKYKEESTATSSSSNYSYIGVEADNLFVAYPSSSYIYLSYMKNYLGTICNLSSPIVKTSAQSMKVTYTLTDV